MFTSIIDPVENPWPQTVENADSYWTFPSTDIEKIRSIVFQNLWERKYYLTSGRKFGGDFLAYPGMLICIDIIVSIM